MTRLVPASSKLAAAVAAMLGVLGLVGPLRAQAQSKSDAFAGKIPPVSAQLYRKAGRFEVAPTLNLSLNDAFYSKYFAGVKVDYHFFESISAGAYFATGLNTKAGSAQVCPSGKGCHSASSEQMYQVPGNIHMMGGVEAAWTPVYGKLNLFSTQVIHFDLGLMAGADWIQYQKVLGKAEAEAGDKPSLASTFGAHAGIGTRIYFSEWMAARLEFRDYIYRVSVPNWQEGGSAKKDLQNQLFAELGVSFFFPMHNSSVQ
jgi:outer membrane beta-barrel protein